MTGVIKRESVFFKSLSAIVNKMEIKYLFFLAGPVPNDLRTGADLRPGGLLANELGGKCLHLEICCISLRILT